MGNMDGTLLANSANMKRDGSVQAQKYVTGLPNDFGHGLTKLANVGFGQEERSAVDAAEQHGQGKDMFLLHIWLGF